MARQQFSTEYIIRSSPTILYNFLITPSGLAQWFSETCDINEGIYSFGWSQSEENAKLLETVENELVRYTWEEGEEDEFFEFKIQKAEVSNDTVLIVTDFADEGELESQQMWWDSQIKMLMQQIGG